MSYGRSMTILKCTWYNGLTFNFQRCTPLYSGLHLNLNANVKIEMQYKNVCLIFHLFKHYLSLLHFNALETIFKS